MKSRCHVLEKFETAHIPIYSKRHGLWITINSQEKQVIFRYIVMDNCETMIFQGQNKVDHNTNTSNVWS